MNRGFSTIELLLAMAIAICVMSVVLIAGGDYLTSGVQTAIGVNQTIVTDSEISAEALHMAQDLIEDAAATARTNYSAVSESSNPVTVGGVIYTESLSIPIAFKTQCSQTVVSTVSWTGTHNRNLYVTAETSIVNVPEMVMSGGTCNVSPPTGGWNPPETYTCARTPSTVAPTALDVFEKIIYLSSDAAPYLHIADANGAPYNPSCNNALNVQFLSFTNGFTAGRKVNDVRVVRADDDRMYAFLAVTVPTPPPAVPPPTNQFRVIDVTNPQAPFQIVAKGLSNIIGGSQPHGFRLFYYDKKVFLVTKETLGPELHVFDVATPWIPGSVDEIGSGYELNRTVESLVITKKLHSGVDHYYAFMASDVDWQEVTVLDMTFPTASTLAVTEITAPDHDLPDPSGGLDGSAVYLVGDRLYVGRLDGTGPLAAYSDLYVFDASTPWAGLANIAESDVIGGVIGIVASGRFAFLSTLENSQDFKVWRSDPTNLTPISTTFNFPNNAIPNAARFDGSWVYLAVDSNDVVRILRST